MNTPAYNHSLDHSHHVFIHLTNGRVWCIPDGYEVLDSSLEDIKFNLHPKYTDEQIAQLDDAKQRVGLNGVSFYPGYVGLNNIKDTDGFNVLIQTLARIKPIRNFFLKPENLVKAKSPVVHTFGELIRKMYNHRNFKGHVSPHEFLQAVNVASNKKFKIGAATDPLELFTWFVNHTHMELGGTTKKQTIITKTFQGSVTVHTEMVELDTENARQQERVTHKDTKTIPFMFLTLDIPPAPLFKDEYERNLIPQVSLFTLLEKYDGKTETATPSKTGLVEKKRYEIQKLPEYLIFHMKRFSKNFFFKEKNPTIVSFPITNLEFQNKKYDLISNIRHEGDSNQGHYTVHVQHNAIEKWYLMSDLDVKQVMPEEVSISESYMQCYVQK
jgi:U4/U6.U5 tri-snRNP-associated protein 2